MTKKLVVILLACFAVVNVFAQSRRVVKFEPTFKQTASGEGEIRIKAKLNKDYHIFSNNPGGDGSLVGTKFIFPKIDGVTTVGTIIEEGKKLDNSFPGVEGEVHWYENEVTFVQKVKFKNRKKFAAKAEFMCCNHEMCERPEYDYALPIDMFKNSDGTIEPSGDATAGLDVKDTIVRKNIDTISKATNNIDTTNTTTAATNTVTPIDTTTANKATVYGEYGTPVGDCGLDKELKLSPWLAFLYGLLGGLAALFFPCTLPMIPMTISYFLKSGGKDEQGKKKGVRNGLMYGFFIFLVYFLLSLPFLFFKLGGQELSNVATNPWLNIGLFVIFMVFAGSLFGYYDLSMPSFLVNKIDSKSNATSPVGIFFMALTLAIVSFSCTGPILGLVLGNVKNASLITPAMSGFGIGLGVPFALFAMFPNLLKALPKSGGWLTTLKVTFAFVEIAFALKFLSNADLVKQWGFLKRELFMAIWLIISVVTAIYLFGKIKIKKHDIPYASITTKIFGVLFFVLSGYIALDFFNVKVDYFGFPPPKFYSYFHKEGAGLKEGTATRTHNLNGVTIYLFLEDAIVEAKKQNKPLMIDFTGWACVNCRRMEETVWIQDKVQDILKNKYIIASLYVDDKRELPANEQFMSPKLQGMAKTVGDKWFDLALRFNRAQQPAYVLIDATHTRILNTPVGYTPDGGKYVDFLNCGIANYNTLKGVK